MTTGRINQVAITPSPSLPPPAKLTTTTTTIDRRVDVRNELDSERYSAFA
jgi:hypothetical protein